MRRARDYAPQDIARLLEETRTIEQHLRWKRIIWTLTNLELGSQDPADHDLAKQLREALTTFGNQLLAVAAAPESYRDFGGEREH